jgi:hypothetical protein
VLLLLRKAAAGAFPSLPALLLPVEAVILLLLQVRLRRKAAEAIHFLMPVLLLLRLEAVEVLRLALLLFPEEAELRRPLLQMEEAAFRFLLVRLRRQEVVVIHFPQAQRLRRREEEAIPRSLRSCPRAVAEELLMNYLYHRQEAAEVMIRSRPVEAAE